jgi:type IX secretion system PorP/SprF family membrane protein
MKKIIFHIVIAILLLSTIVIKAQQNTNFNTYSYDLMQVNVAAMGSSAFQANLNYRTQAIKVNNAPTLYQLNAYMRLGDKQALGIKVYQNSVHLTAFNNITGAYSYKLKLNKEAYLNFGLGVSYYQVRFNAQDAIVTDEDDPNLENDGTALRSNNFDAEVGTEFKWKKFKAGLAVNHLYNTNNDLGNISTNTPREVNLYASYNFKLSKDFEMTPWILDRYREGGGFTPEGILNLRFKKAIGLGLGYRYSNFLISNLMVEVGPIKLVYSFEYSLSEVARTLGSTHQIMLGFDLQKKKTTETPTDETKN